MKNKEFIEHVRATFTQCLEVLEKKNHDYAGIGDPFANVKNAMIVHVSVEQGIMVRTLDKISRIGNLLMRPAKVKESLRETIIDAINYLAILLAYIESKK